MQGMIYEKEAAENATWINYLIDENIFRQNPINENNTLPSWLGFV